MRLSLDTRQVGRVTIVCCNGRIVSGGESEALRSHVAWLLHDRRSIVLHLADVAFIDSSGLGTMVRTLTSVRQSHGDLKLCNVPEHVRKVLDLSHLTKLFDAHESEEQAVAAFYSPKARTDTVVPTGPQRAVPRHRCQRARLLARAAARRLRRPHQQPPARRHAVDAHHAFRRSAGGPRYTSIPGPRGRPFKRPVPGCK
jgi:anti-sigma B factor antagonist